MYTVHARSFFCSLPAKIDTDRVLRFSQQGHKGTFPTYCLTNISGHFFGGFSSSEGHVIHMFYYSVPLRQLSVGLNPMLLDQFALNIICEVCFDDSYVKSSVSSMTE